MKAKTTIVAALFTLFIALQLYGQELTGSISGKIIDKTTNQPIPFASIVIDTLKIAVTSDEKGVYTIPNLPSGTYNVSVTLFEYKTQTIEVSIVAPNTVSLDFSPEKEEKVKELGVITIVGAKNKADEVREQAFTVTSIDVKPMQNLNLDVNTVLNRSSGIRIRQEGGLGSNFNFSLNGFSGNQVRFFIDGISSDYLGSTMRLNNIPVNVIERIEVYKGVVPIHLGADALGGAVNVITNDNTIDFLDVSYSHGSFNTHQAALSSRLNFKKKFVLNASGFFNYSENNYTVDAQVVDKQTGKIGEPQPFKLFNEDYISGSAMIEAGFIKTKWTDRFLIGLIASSNKHNYQRGRAVILSPLGLVHTTDKSLIPTLKYQKKNFLVKNLSFNLSAVYSNTDAMSVDTSSRIYSWDGTYSLRKFGSTSGEASWYKTMFVFNDRSTFNTATLAYTLGKHHTFTLNNTYSYFWRKGSDAVASEYSESIAFSNPNTISKNITGLSYKLNLMEDRWQTTLFGKLFNMDASVKYRDDFSGEWVSTKNTVSKTGEGIASTFFITKKLQLKTSYENTTRLPESYELFGDGLLLLPNAQLQPERSKNFNVGLLSTRKINSKHKIRTEGGFIYRLPQDMIRLVSVGVLSEYQNLSTARVMGGEGAIVYTYKKWFNAEVNLTYQDMVNTNKSIDSYPDPLYLDRIPNIPYLFGNGLAGFQTSAFGKKKYKIGFNWSTMYVEQFYLNWPSQGAKNTKYIIPRQLAHDVSISLSAFSGLYNISFSCANIADNKLYDNFKIQKPGRSFNVKLRIFFEKFRN